MSAGRRNLADSEDTWWTIDQTAEHFGITRAAVLRWIREGLPLRLGLIRREEALAEFRTRKQRQAATRGKSTSA